MKQHSIPVVLIAAVLLLGARPSFAFENMAETAPPKAVSKPQPKAIAKIKPVDINSATLKQLKKLPGIGDVEAQKIIAGRPYGSKAWLATHNILPAATYEALQDLVEAKQPFADANKNAEIYINAKKK
jgi:DNA uptake protein ComE-like DNA-binding protein